MLLFTKPDISFAQRIDRYPSLKNRIELSLSIIEDSAGDCQKAGTAETSHRRATANGINTGIKSVKLLEDKPHFIITPDTIRWWVVRSLDSLS